MRLSRISFHTNADLALFGLKDGNVRMYYCVDAILQAATRSMTRKCRSHQPPDHMLWWHGPFAIGGSVPLQGCPACLVEGSNMFKGTSGITS